MSGRGVGQQGGILPVSCIGRVLVNGERNLPNSGLAGVADRATEDRMTEDRTAEQQRSEDRMAEDGMAKGKNWGPVGVFKGVCKARVWSTGVFATPLHVVLKVGR